MNPVNVQRGDGPVVLGVPHSGTYVPADVFDRLTPLGQSLADADWHVDRLYDGLLPGRTMVKANFHRYVVDANRDPSGASLYPDQNTTGLVPMTDFDGHALWCDPPDEEEIESRRISWHAPYHAALRAELARVKANHGVAVLYDCHSIRSQAPYLFEGTLPDFNIGTNNGATCDPALERAVSEACQQARDYSMIVNGRFRGGWTTREYGRPSTGVHTIQMELAQSTYLRTEALPFEYDEVKAGRVRIHLAVVLETIERAACQLRGRS